MACKDECFDSLDADKTLNSEDFIGDMPTMNPDLAGVGRGLAKNGSKTGRGASFMR